MYILRCTFWHELGVGAGWSLPGVMTVEPFRYPEVKAESPV